MNNQRQMTDTDFSPVTLSVSTKDETMNYVTNSPEEGKLDDCKALEIKRSKRKLEVCWGLNHKKTIKRRLQG